MGTTAENTEADQVVLQNPLIKALREHGKGNAVEDMAKAFCEVVDAVMKQAKKGQLTIKLDINPAKNEGMVDVGVDITTKIPRPTIPDRSFYVCPDNSLSVDHPGQLRIDGI